jgi:hypothetical protein
MKKSLLFFIASVVLLASAGNAQDSRVKPQFGPKIGLNLSNVYDTEGESFDADAKLGLAAGVFVSLPLGPHFGIHPEILFSQKGFKASGSILGSSYVFTRTLNYIDIPLMLAFKPSEMFTIVAGPQYSYLISRKDVFTNEFVNVEVENEFNNETLRKNTICFLTGFDVNINRVVIGARAGWDLFQNNGDGTSQTPRYKNVWFQATIGFRI